ncbi:MAG: mycoredoxin [Chloroflexi bacterium]|nr:mycoredoxin [Chloroflexota bacterium]
MSKEITVYGTRWCGDCSRSKAVLDREGISYAWIDIGKDTDAREFVKSINTGMMSVPTIVFPDGSVLVEPTDRTLSEKLRAA